MLFIFNQLIIISDSSVSDFSVYISDFQYKEWMAA